MSFCLFVSLSPFYNFAVEYQLFKFLNMKITRTAPDVFNICELSAAELSAILTTIECSAYTELDGLSHELIKELNEKLWTARESMMQRERMKKKLTKVKK